MPAFDRDFFHELSTFDLSTLSAIKYSGRNDVSDMHSCNLVSHNFKCLTESIKSDVFKSSKKYKLDESFRCNPHHIFTYPKKLSFRKQFNIAFTVEGVPEEFDGRGEAFDKIHDNQCTARIGIGFRTVAEVNNDGAIDYFYWEKVVKDSHAEFDTIFQSVGSYGEPEHLFSPLTAEKIINNRPNPSDDWRFFGRHLTLDSDSHILTNYDAFINEVVRVFRIIDGSPFR